jgi:hypothetical protein
MALRRTVKINMYQILSFILCNRLPTNEKRNDSGMVPRTVAILKLSSFISVKPARKLTTLNGDAMVARTVKIARGPFLWIYCR